MKLIIWSLHRKLAILIFIIYLCPSCARPIIHTSFSDSKNIGNVPFYPQVAHQCGPASLAGVLNFWGINVSPDEIASEIYSPNAKGTLTIDMVLYAKKMGMNATTYKGNLVDIKEKINSGYPIIVLVDLGFWIFKKHHFMVITGYNNDSIIVNSGREQQKYISQRDFLKKWKKTNYWTILITPR